MVYICIGMYLKFNNFFFIIRFYYIIKYDINYEYLFYLWILCKISIVELILKYMVMKLCKFYLKMY